jgi:hypothetical protein
LEGKEPEEKQREKGEIKRKYHPESQEEGCSKKENIVSGVRCYEETSRRELDLHLDLPTRGHPKFK